MAPSTSSDKNLRTADLGFAWNILDFGVSYYQAQEQADRTLILKERRRKVGHSLMHQVRQAYWLALAAQEVEGKAAAMQKDVDSALSDLDKIQRERLRAPKEVLAERRQLLDTQRQLESIRDELAQAKPHLAALMNLDPSQQRRQCRLERYEEVVALYRTDGKSAARCGSAWPRVPRSRPSTTRS